MLKLLDFKTDTHQAFGRQVADRLMQLRRFFEGAHCSELSLLVERLGQSLRNSPDRRPRDMSSLRSHCDALQRQVAVH